MPAYLLNLLFTYLYIDIDIDIRIFGSDDNVDADPHAEDTATYTAKMGRWAQQALAALHDPRFWCMMSIAHRTRGPLDHFAHYVAKKHGPDDPTSLARMVWYKASQIGNELAELHNNEQWPEWIEYPDLMEVGRSVAAELSAQAHADFHTRILHKLSPSSPNALTLLFLAKAGPKTFCRDRQRLCEEILDRHDSSLDPAVSKIKTLFREDMREAARTGKISNVLYILFRLVSIRWHGHVQEIEGINNIIQQCCTRAPRIDLPLLDARVAIRQFIGLGSRESRDMRWKLCAPILEDVVRDYTSNYDAVDDVMADPIRWSPHPIAKPQLLPKEPLPLALRDLNQQALKWAGQCSINLVGLCKQARETYGGMPVLRVGDDEAWLCSKIHRFTVVLRRMKVDPGCKNDIVLENPPVFSSSVAVFGNMYNSLVARKAKAARISLAGFDGIDSCIGIPSVVALQDPRPRKVGHSAKRLKAIADKDEQALALEDGQIDAMVAELHGNINDDAEEVPTEDADLVGENQVESGDEIVVEEFEGMPKAKAATPADDAVSTDSLQQALIRWRESFDVSCSVLLERQEALGT